MASPEQGARILPWPRAPASHKTEREFLPAALEIIETPASPLGRGIIFAGLAFFCAALAWSWLGRVDIIATAQGRLMPSGRVKVVQPLEQGIVRDIRVQDGISPDAVTADRRQGDDSAAQTEGRSSQEEKPASASPAYVARVALESSTMLIDGEVAGLRPGMAASAEIKTGSRRILEYLLSPLRQSAQEAIRER